MLRSGIPHCRYRVFGFAFGIAYSASHIGIAYSVALHKRSTSHFRLGFLFVTIFSLCINLSCNRLREIRSKDSVRRMRCLGESSIPCILTSVSHFRYQLAVNFLLIPPPPLPVMFLSILYFCQYCHFSPGSTTRHN